MKDLLKGFEKLEIKKGGKGEKMAVRINARKTGIAFTKKLSDVAGLQKNDRYDLYKSGNTFALVKDAVGLLKVSKGGDQYIIASKNTCLEIAVEAGEQKVFNAWVDEGIIFFRVDK